MHLLPGSLTPVSRGLGLPTNLTWRRGSMVSAAHRASSASPSSPSSVNQRQPAQGGPKQRGEGVVKQQRRLR